MAREIFEVTKDRFHLQDPCCYILQGTWPKEAKMRAKLDGSEVKAESSVHWNDLKIQT